MAFGTTDSVARELVALNPTERQRDTMTHDIHSAADTPSPHNSDLPGGIHHPAVVLDKNHTLIAIDPSLNAVLERLEPKLLETYSKVKLLTEAPTPPGPGSIDFIPVSFTTQVVAGTNYFVKLRVVHNKNPTVSDSISAPAGVSSEAASNQEYIHVKIFSQPWTQTAELTGMAVNKHAQDSLEDPIPMILDA
ncbi:hypothetical protein BGZ98_006933 [Dissophora globulifera]|nr:hypothetical protein BGZ98_006933 [Dissophora globulifera]